MYIHATQYKSATVGGRLVDVRCEKCGCEYFYQLARIGSGSSASVYGIGGGAAAKSAQNQSQKDLHERLAHEAELVPCPKCHWINDDLVQGYRKGRDRGYATLAIYVGAVGTAASLIWAWFTSTGPVADRSSVSTVLIVGPTIFIGLAVAIMLLRNWRRSRIRPNELFPFPPLLPAGSPPALIQNPTSGELEIAHPQQRIGNPAHEWLEFQLGRDKLPGVCCHCLGRYEPNAFYREVVLPGLQIQVPFCNSCARHRKWHNRRLGFGAFVASLVCAMGILFLLRLGHDAFWMGFVAICLIAPAIGGAVAHERGKPVRTKVVDAARGIIRIWFPNGEYQAMAAEQVAEAAIRPG